MADFVVQIDLLAYAQALLDDMSTSYEQLQYKTELLVIIKQSCPAYAGALQVVCIGASIIDIWWCVQIGAKVNCLRLTELYSVPTSNVCSDALCMHDIRSCVHTAT